MSKVRALTALLLFLLGAFCFSLFSQLLNYEKDLYRAKEPFFACPVPSEANTVLLRNDEYGKGTFGASRSGGRVHKGVDLRVPLGGEVFASKSGRVATVGVDKGYGNYIELLHPDGLKTVYAHLSRITVSEGDWVTGETVVGKAGKTGNAADPRILSHLHFEIQKDGKALDPMHGLLDPKLIVR